jgi:hypothetical protein
LPWTCRNGARSGSSGAISKAVYRAGIGNEGRGQRRTASAPSSVKIARSASTSAGVAGRASGGKPRIALVTARHVRAILRERPRDLGGLEPLAVPLEERGDSGPQLIALRFRPIPPEPRHRFEPRKLPSVEITQPQLDRSARLGPEWIVAARLIEHRPALTDRDRQSAVRVASHVRRGMETAVGQTREHELAKGGQAERGLVIISDLPVWLQRRSTGRISGTHGDFGLSNNATAASASAGWSG